MLICVRVSRPEITSIQWIGNFSFVSFAIIGVIEIIIIILQINALLATLELNDSAQRKDHFALYNCLVLGHTKYNGVQRVYCNPFPAKPFYGSHRLDLVMIRPPGIDHGGFVLTPFSLVRSGFGSFINICSNRHSVQDV
jgi:hypothetical protein